MERCYPGCCVCTENACPARPVFDYDVGPGCLKFCPGPPRFWYILSLRPILVYIPNSIVVCTLGCVGMRGIRVKRCCPGSCVRTKNVGPGLPVFDYDVGLGYLKFCP